MKIVKNTSDELVSKLAAGEADAAYNTIMSSLDQINSLIQTIDPQQYSQYLKDIWRKMDGVHHALGGTLQAQDPQVNPEAPQQVAPTDNPML